MTYQSCETVQPREVDSLSSSTTEEPYIIETPGDFGKIQFWHEYNIEDDVLIIGLVQAKGIVCKTNAQTSSLLPKMEICKDDRVVVKRQLASQSMSFAPTWNEEILFPLDGNSLNELTFRVTLLEVDAYSKMYLIGKLSVEVKDFGLGDLSPQWYDLDGEEKVNERALSSIAIATELVATPLRICVR